MKGAGGACHVGRSGRKEMVFRAQQRLACGQLLRFPADVLRWQPLGSQATATAVPTSEAHEFELCARWGPGLGAASVQPGLLLWGGGVGTRCSAGALLAPDLWHTSAASGLQVGWRRASSFLRLIKPCLVEEGGGTGSITLSHRRLHVTWNQGSIRAEVREPVRTRPWRLPQDHPRGLGIAGGPEVGGQMRGRGLSSVFVHRAESEPPLQEWGRRADPYWLGGWGMAGREKGCRAPRQSQSRGVPSPHPLPRPQIP